MTTTVEYAAELHGPLAAHIYGPVSEEEARRVVCTTLGAGHRVLWRQDPVDTWRTHPRQPTVEDVRRAFSVA